MNVLVLNCGSSSIKYEVFQIHDWFSRASGLLERLGEPESRLRHRSPEAAGETAEIVRRQPVADHREGMELIARLLHEHQVIRGQSELAAIGHRVVHGGDAFRKPALIDDGVLATIRAQSPLAPLHNPANIVGIEATMSQFPAVPQVAVFDTAFHQSIPRHAYRYALPEEICQSHKVRRYGFHGTSHFYVAKQSARYLGKPLAALRLIVLHLGNGASVTAVRDGHSVDTSMGLTPLEGLVMGTRCGDIDPAIIFYLARATGMSNDELESMLNKQSGLKGICGENDMREVLRRSESGDTSARLAVEMFAYRIKKYLGAYLAILGGADAVVFTAGIGENSPEIRARCCAGLEHLGIQIDPAKNESRHDGAVELQQDGGPVKILVIPTDEELEIAQEAVEALRAEREHHPSAAGSARD
jgi:acetate kinase